MAPVALRPVRGNADKRKLGAPHPVPHPVYKHVAERPDTPVGPDRVPWKNCLPRWVDPDKWSTENHPTPSALNLPWGSGPQVWKMPRREAAEWMAEVTGHGDYPAYHRRFGHPRENRGACAEKSGIRNTLGVASLPGPSPAIIGGVYPNNGMDHTPWSPDTGSTSTNSSARM